MTVFRIRFMGLALAVLSGAVGNVHADMILLSASILQSPLVELHHYSSATEGFDSGLDATYQPFPLPAIDFFSQVSGYDLWVDVRPLDSVSTYHTRMQGRGLTGLTEGYLSLYVDAATSFGGLPIYADVYKNGSLVQGDIDVRKYSTDPEDPTVGTKVPLSFSNDADYYNIDVRFTAAPEPSSLTLLGMGTGVVAFGWWRRGLRVQ